MKVVGFVLVEPFSDWEYAYLASALRMLGEEKYVCRYYAPGGTPVRSIGSATLLPDGDVAQAENCDALALIGGLGWRSPQTAAAVGPLVRAYSKSGRPLGAICDAVGFIGGYGLLDTRRHTGNGVDEIRACGKEAYNGESLYQSQQVVRDQHLITANGTAPLEFAREMLLELGLDEQKVGEWYDFHKLGFCATGIPSGAK